MGTLRSSLNRQFKEKVYPNPTDPAVAEAIERGRQWFKEEYLGKTYPWVLNGAQIRNGAETYATHNPSDRNLVVGTFPAFRGKRDLKDLDKLLSDIRHAGLRFFKTTPWQRRVELLHEISKVVEERFWLFVAAKQYETGQSIMEAIGETDEAVDFPLAVAMYLEEIHEEKLLETPKFAGDYNGKRYVPHGVFLNIVPFNFPGAIPMDMACKALAMGNAIIEKSSDKSSLCGYLVYESIAMAFERLGISHKGVVNYAPGGPEVVDILLSSPDIAGVSFTGSSAALKEIKKKHGTLLRRGYHGRAPLVFASAETSGVNTVVVWRDADVAHAAKECLKSVVGRQGQKCSSVRVIMVHKDIAVPFVAALEEGVRSVRYGNPLLGDDVGTVITKKAEAAIRSAIQRLFAENIVQKKYAHPLSVPIDGEAPTVPTILYAGDILADESKAKKLMNTEIFGPVTTVISVGSLEDVEKLCELSDFALTGGSFTADIDTRIRLSEVIPAGNLYHNRKCTGALVESECFGGLRSLSSPSGIKGKQSLALFGSMQTVSGFYDPSWGSEGRQQFLARMQNELGFVFSKT